MTPGQIPSCTVHGTIYTNCICIHIAPDMLFQQTIVCDTKLDKETIEWYPGIEYKSIRTSNSAMATSVDIKGENFGPAPGSIPGQIVHSVGHYALDTDHPNGHDDGYGHQVHARLIACSHPLLNRTAICLRFYTRNLSIYCRCMPPLPPLPKSSFHGSRGLLIKAFWESTTFSIQNSPPISLKIQDIVESKLMLGTIVHSWLRALSLPWPLNPSSRISPPKYSDGSDHKHHQKHNRATRGGQQFFASQEKSLLGCSGRDRTV